MNINIPLTPRLEQFIREQLTSGRFDSEAEIVAAALRLLEIQSNSTNTQRTALSSGTGVNRSSPRGILSDLQSNLTFDEIQEARHEMWAGLGSGLD